VRISHIPCICALQNSLIPLQKTHGNPRNLPALEPLIGLPGQDCLSEQGCLPGLAWGFSPTNQADHLSGL
jgi:hypothetical protein